MAFGMSGTEGNPTRHTTHHLAAPGVELRDIIATLCTTAGRKKPEESSPGPPVSVWSFLERAKCLNAVVDRLGLLPVKIIRRSRSTQRTPLRDNLPEPVLTKGKRCARAGTWTMDVVMRVGNRGAPQDGSCPSAPWMWGSFETAPIN
jgi:hypothetical protein